MDVVIQSGNVLREFRKRLASAQEVRIASAWLSDSGALDALLEHRCQVRAIIGVHGNTTSPETLSLFGRRMEWQNVRIADRHGPLFHPKLFIFRYAKKRDVAWIGSANFTGHGMEVNKELVIQTDDPRLVAELQTWFDAEWENTPDDSEDRLGAYNAKWKRPGKFEGDRGGARQPTRHIVRTEGARRDTARIRFQPTRGRAESEYTGTAVFGSRREAYTSHTDALRAVLDVLRTGRTGYLRRCAGHRSFVVHHRGGGSTSAYLATDRNRIKEVRAANGELTAAAKARVDEKGIKPILFAHRWWLSRDMEPKANTWRMVLAAVEIAGVEITPDGAEPGF